MAKKTTEIKEEIKDQTTLLPPDIAVRIAWALTGQFSKSKQSKDIYLLADKQLKDIQEKAIGKEKEYVDLAIPIVLAGMRSLDTIYKWRELNFEENEKLRSVALDDVKETMKFGQKAGDFLKSLPAMTVAAGGGAAFSIEVLNLPASAVWGLGVGLAGASFWVYRWYTHMTNKQKQKIYLKQDYERNLYFEKYRNQVLETLETMYSDIDRVHKRVFHQEYKLEKTENASKIVEDALIGIKPTMCEHVSNHLEDGSITAEYWPRCEVGGKAAEECKQWPKKDQDKS
ncbi:MAG: hypothetical protein HWN69_09650 [Desulfobacterales bacterium]|nr:hypothetical protein [Desulfobacterales bacterium]